MAEVKAEDEVEMEIKEATGTAAIRKITKGKITLTRPLRYDKRRLMRE
jgi:hypothetical protein